MFCSGYLCGAAIGRDDFDWLPLWRRATLIMNVLRDAANLEILRDQTTELAKDLGTTCLPRNPSSRVSMNLRVRLLEESTGLT